MSEYVEKESVLRLVKRATWDHGKWITAEDGGCTCSNCGETMAICFCGKDKTRSYEYCPNCGAKMEVDND